MKKKSLASRSTTGVICVISPLIFAFAVALDIYVPSIPDVRAYFNVDQQIMQLTVSLFLLLTGLGQLIFGPISDQVGRRPITLLSISLLILGSLICTFAYNIEMLILGRMVQALGACGMMVCCFAIVRDVFSEKECGSVYSFLNSSITISPLLAPLIGGYLAVWFNWRASFVFLTMVAVLIFILAFRNINETLSHRNQRNLNKQLFYDYFFVIKHLKFLIFTFCACAGFACFLVFFSISPYILISLLKVPEQHFGFYFGGIAVLFFPGSLLSGYCANKKGVYTTVLIGAILMLISGLMMWGWNEVYGLTVGGFVIPMCVMAIAGAFLMGGGAGGAIAPFPQMAGTASALFGCLQFSFAFIISQIVMLWPVKSTLPLADSLIWLGIIVILICLISYRNRAG